MSNDLSDRLTTLTCDLVQIVSTESRPLARADCFAYCRLQMEGLSGIEIREHNSRGFCSLVAMPRGVEVPGVLLVGHLDVIEHASPDVYHTTVRAGRIWGPGAGDMKGQCAIMLELFVRLQRQFPGLPFGVAFTSDEERGGEDGVRFLFEEAGLRCGSAIVPDGGSLNAVTVEEKGILQMKLKVEGKEGHAAAPWLASNALATLVSAVARLCAHFETYEDVSSPDHWYPTCAPTMCHCPNPTVNCIPGTAEAVVDIRFPAPHTVESMHAEVLQNLGPEVMAETLASAIPTQLAPDELYLKITEEITGKSVRRHRASGGSDALFISQYGIPVVLSSPIVGNLHREDEWIDQASMETYYRICERYMLERLQAV